MRSASAPRRAAFTLVELLVAMALAIVLMSLALAVSQSGAFGSQRVVGAADRVSGWLLIAKQRALRDGTPVGVRFLPDPNNQNLLTGAFYVQGSGSNLWVPNPKTVPGGARLAFYYTINASNMVTNRQAFLVTDNPAQDLTYNAASPNTTFDGLDMQAQAQGATLTVIVPGYGQPVTLQNNPSATPTASQPTVQTSNAAPTVSPNARELKFPASAYPDLGAAYTPAGTPPPPYKATAVTYGVAFQVPPQPLFGEPALAMPDNTAIDIQTTPQQTTYNMPAGNEIIFAPSGQVLNQPSGAQILLWVRDPTAATDPYNFAAAGPESLIVISTKTGAISTQPVNPDPADPYKFAKLGLNAGF